MTIVGPSSVRVDIRLNDFVGEVTKRTKLGTVLKIDKRLYVGLTRSILNQSNTLKREVSSQDSQERESLVFPFVKDFPTTLKSG